MERLVFLIMVVATFMMISCGTSTEDGKVEDFITDRDSASTRIPAEWETQKAVWLNWPQDAEYQFRPAFIRIISVVQQYEQVNIIILNKSMKESVVEGLQKEGL